MSEVVIVDYGMGNLRSVEHAVTHLGTSAIISDKPEAIHNAKKIILPGVGLFATAIRNIKARNLWQPLNDAVTKRQVPLLGICLGMQLLARTSEEGGITDGFGWIAGDVKRIAPSDSSLKIPHIGFNTVTFKSRGVLGKGLTEADFYFVHSFCLHCDNAADVAATSQYGQEIVAAIEHKNVFGTQFHPEKSQENGLVVLKNFLDI